MMKNLGSQTISIAKSTGQTGLSQAQKRFNSLTQKIDSKRQNLIAWQAMLPLYHQKYSDEFYPLLTSFDQKRTDFVQLLDKSYSDKVFSKSDRKKISHIICMITMELMSERDCVDLKKIYNKYSEIDFDSRVEQEKEMMQSAMAEMFSFDIFEKMDVNSTEKIMENVGEEIQQELIQEERVKKQFEGSYNEQKKSAKTLAREEKQQAEIQNISQSLREIYRKLASSLHPDREQDAEERERKTELMQRVNIAYNSKNLLELLALQLEIEQIDQSIINTLPEDKLKYYNTILAEQFAELQNEINDIEVSFKIRLNMSPRCRIVPMTVIRDLQNDIKNIQRDIDRVEADLTLFRESKNIKNWLKTYRIARAK
ncbi:J domain-containing protein [Candidatus Fukatsuia symbiotica]|uniref:Molecular chaperone DnaJ n=1 Tax=Candidatus Fukatsuia symbiotica TaxID=1878942 RepID=A0A2U8I6A0_9GAMM|nr:J domain-containing protein [Candidatus Fukatsuia symbiotica]AWK14672.1 hypothetical protein CCS41_09580 [Candidatus Fukatsuia symbiotica]MEA9444990.1 J domain-containing protein [Candidatus Fukatsuia symbiotica]